MPPEPLATLPLGIEEAELELLARAVGESLPWELAERVVALRARRRELARLLDADPSG